MNTDSMIDDIQKIRQTLEMVIHAVEQLSESDEISQSLICLNTSKMEMGRVLFELGSTSPYRFGKNPTTEKIARTNKHGGRVWDNEGMSHVRSVKALRKSIDQIEKDIKKCFELIQEEESWTRTHLKEAVLFLIRGGMWLGMELGRINMERESYR